MAQFSFGKTPHAGQGIVNRAFLPISYQNGAMP